MWSLKKQQEESKPYEAVPTFTRPAPSEIVRTETVSQPRGNTMEQTAMIGQSIHIKGELTGDENLTIEGKIEGRIDLKEHHLTIGKSGNIKADLHAKTITIIGEVLGNITAEDKIEIKETGKLRGDVVTPRMSIADGAYFKGSVEMGSKPTQTQEKPLLGGKTQPRPPERLATPA